MKKRMFTVLAVFSLALSGCSFNDVTDWLGTNIVDPVKNLLGLNSGEEEQHEHEHSEEGEHHHEEGGGSQGQETKTLQSIAITGNLNKTTYDVDETYSLAGLRVYAHYNVGSDEDVTSSATLVANPSKAKLGDTSITVSATYSGKETSKTFTVTVNDPTPVQVLESIAIQGELDKTHYEVGDDYVLDGLKVFAKYNFGDDEDVTAKATLTSEPAKASKDDKFITVKATYEGKEASETYAVTIQEEEQPHTYTMQSDANEHWYVDDVTGDISGREEHIFHEVSSLEQTCEHASKKVEKCEVCDYERITNGTEIGEHHYESQVTKEATCQEDGEITFRCTVCNDTFTQPITNRAAHRFGEGVVSEGVTTYHCLNCGFEKTTLDYSDHQSASVNTEDLSSAGEIELSNASIGFDEETLAQFDSEVTVAAEPVQVEELTELDDESKEMLEGKPILDFSVTNTDSNEKISEFDGKVEISIPYQLQQGEEAEGIAIWYIDGNSTDVIKADFTNGNVSFETSHFSYYAVIHLNPSEICDRFGHEMVKGSIVASTCTAHGHDDMICRRCKMTESETLPLAEHDYQFVQKVESTTTTQGFIKYVCKDCGDEHFVYLPLKEEVESGFYMNFAKSVMTPEYMIETSSESQGMTYKYTQYEGYDEEGYYFEYNVSSSFNQENATYKGYYYSSDFYRYEDHSENRNLFIFDIVKDVLTHLPESTTEKVEDLCNWLVETLFVREEVDEGYKFTINYARINEIYNAFKEGTLTEGLIALIGQDAYDAIFTFIEEHYEGTLDKLLTDLAGLGFDIAAIYASVKEVLIAHGMSEEMLPDFDAIVTEELRGMRVVDIVNVVVPQIMESMNGSSGSGQEVKPEEGYEGKPEHTEEPKRLLDRDPSEGEGQEGGEEQPEIPTLIPETYVEFKAVIDQFLEANIIDVVCMITGSPQEAKESLIQMADAYVLGLDQIIDLSLITTTSGQFVSLNMNATEPTENGNGSVAHVTISKAFDKATIVSRIQEMAEKCEARENAFKLDATNYEWFSKPYNEYFRSKYGLDESFEFEFVRDYHNQGRDALVGNKEITLTLTHRDYYEIPYGETRTYTGIPVFKFSSYYNEYGWSRGRIVTNRYGLGTLTEKNERSLILNTGELMNSSFNLEYTNEGEANSEIYVSRAPKFGILFDFDDYSYHYTSNGGSYDYLDQEFYSYTFVTREEYVEQTGREIEKDSDQMIFFKVVSKVNPTNVYYDYSYGSVTEYAFSRNMSQTALEHYKDFAIEHKFRNGKRYDVYYADDVKAPDFSFDSSYNYEKDEFWNYPEANYNKDQTKTVQYGNTKIVYENKHTSLKCTRKISWKIYVDSQIISSSSYTYHFEPGQWTTNKNLGSVEIDACHTQYSYAESCSVCGKELGVYSSISVHHSGEAELVGHYEREMTLTRPGYSYDLYECPLCHEQWVQYFKTEYPCNHGCTHDSTGDLVYDEETGLYYCEHCGETFENNFIPQFIFENFESDEDYIKFSMFAPAYESYEMYKIREYYQFYLVAGYLNDNGEFVDYTSCERPLYFDQYYEDIEGYGLMWWYVGYDLRSYYEFMNEAYERYEGQDLIVAIMAVPNDGGTVHIYEIN